MTETLSRRARRLLLPTLAVAGAFVAAPASAAGAATGGGQPCFGLAWALPFIGMLLSIALGPLVVPRFWHHHYGKVALGWALAFLLPHGATHGPAAALATAAHAGLLEFLPFILLLGALFVVAGGIRVTGTLHGTPAINTAMLAFGTLIAGVIGTTGAAMVMVRPMIRANHHRRATHVFVFFIFLVANIGGALTPLGDPPLFLGYLEGVPFLWPARHLALPMLLVAGGMLALFYLIDTIAHRRQNVAAPLIAEFEKLGIQGKRNLALLLVVIGGVLMRGIWRPDGGVAIFGAELGYDDLASDALLLAVGALSLGLTSAARRRANGFTWEPIIEVAILFAAIFVTIAPVLAIIHAGAAGPAGGLVDLLFRAGQPDEQRFYWATGLLSGFLDNAPTYLVFFNLAGGDPAQLTGPLAGTLTAISAGAVFFGAVSYIGNAPNYMVRAIAVSHGIPMPSFFGYVGWAAVLLGPLLAITGVVFLG